MVASRVMAPASLIGAAYRQYSSFAMACGERVWRWQGRRPKPQGGFQADFFAGDDRPPSNG
jgi:hypothetical protein